MIDKICMSAIIKKISCNGMREMTNERIFQAMDEYARIKWDEACDELLGNIGAGFIINITKAEKQSDKDVFQAIGETIKNFPKPKFN